MITQQDWRDVMVRLNALANVSLDEHKIMIAMLLDERERNRRFVQQISDRLDALNL
jgi:hypothetical protein